MIDLLKNCTVRASNKEPLHITGYLPYVLTTLEIIAIANEVCYSDVLMLAVDAISRYSSSLYSEPYLNKTPAQINQLDRVHVFGQPSAVGQSKPVSNSTTQSDSLPAPSRSGLSPAKVDHGNNVKVSEQVQATNSKGTELFSNLPESLQNDIIRKRLRHLEDDRFIPLV